VEHRRGHRFRMLDPSIRLGRDLTILIIISPEYAIIPSFLKYNGAHLVQSLDRTPVRCYEVQ